MVRLFLNTFEQIELKIQWGKPLLEVYKMSANA